MIIRSESIEMEEYRLPRRNELYSLKQFEEALFVRVWAIVPQIMSNSGL